MRKHLIFMNKFLLFQRLIDSRKKYIQEVCFFFTVAINSEKLHGICDDIQALRYVFIIWLFLKDNTVQVPVSVHCPQMMVQVNQNISHCDFSHLLAKRVCVRIFDLD